MSFQQLRSIPISCFGNGVYPPPRKLLKFRHLLVGQGILFFMLFNLVLGLHLTHAQSSSPIYNAVYYYVGSPSPDSFMLENNPQIINRLKVLNCNAIFLPIKVSQYGYQDVSDGTDV